MYWQARLPLGETTVLAGKTSSRRDYCTSRQDFLKERLLYWQARLPLGETTVLAGKTSSRRDYCTGRQDFL